MMYIQANVCNVFGVITPATYCVLVWREFTLIPRANYLCVAHCPKFPLQSRVPDHIIDMLDGQIVIRRSENRAPRRLPHHVRQVLFSFHAFTPHPQGPAPHPSLPQCFTLCAPFVTSELALFFHSPSWECFSLPSR